MPNDTNPGAPSPFSVPEPSGAFARDVPTDPMHRPPSAIQIPQWLWYVLLAGGGGGLMGGLGDFLGNEDLKNRLSKLENESTQMASQLDDVEDQLDDVERAVLDVKDIVERAHPRFPE